MIKYIPDENVKDLRLLFNAIKQVEPDCRFVIVDTEGDVYYKSNDVEQAIESIDGGDEEVGVNVYKGKDCLGWFSVMPYEYDSIPYDYTDNDFCDKVWEIVKK